MNDNNVDLVLASASPRRKDLLAGLNIRFRIIPSDVDETVLNGETPQDNVRRLALAKARDVSPRTPGLWVLGADTIVVIDNRILGKPGDAEEAKTMLAMLAGKTHEVYSGYALVNSAFPDKEIIRNVVSQVFIRDLSPSEISDYVTTGEPMDKAGAYAIQGIGSGIVQRISGSYTNVVGLPLCEVARDLQELGIFDFLKANACNDC
ncbi:MAG: septum formation inhibitor Maf [Desulfomonile tiedjei]|uniref:dTTP/UTP pyrophosphatase n=1 Tax=Desulfomonile tiedjei TaxID=2358 RepID=A0A9D6UZS9_9BACT|nr:septum formation inhibitor Maf [Desulfomonile tiedjei]